MTTEQRLNNEVRTVPLVASEASNLAKDGFCSGYNFELDDDAEAAMKKSLTRMDEREGEEKIFQECRRCWTPKRAEDQSN